MIEDRMGTSTWTDEPIVMATPNNNNNNQRHPRFGRLTLTEAIPLPAIYASHSLTIR
jgi:hypothetical protein